MTGSATPLRFRAAQWFHRYVTRWRLLALVAFYSVILFIVNIPAGVAVFNTQNQNHRDLATSRAEDMAAFMDENFIRMSGSMDLVRGFIASAAPLHAPEYFVDNATIRVRKTVRTGTPGALSYRAFLRVNEMVKQRFIGYANLVVQPGLVNVLSNFGASTSGGDWFVSAFEQYDLMVNRSSDLVRLPTTPGNQSQYLILRTLVFTDINNVSQDPNEVDPATGHHVNWNYLWGGLSVVMNLTYFASTPELSSRAWPDRFHWMFESEATTLSTFSYPTVTLFATDTPDKFRKRNAARACCTSPELRSLCFSIMPRGKYWDGQRVPELVPFLIGIDIGFALLCIIVLFGGIRLIVGPPPDPLRYAPMKTPMHAVCVDLPDANRMWGEVPFIMHEVTTTFSNHLEAIAAEHRVYVTMRLGCTAVAVSSSRERALAFARAMAVWGHTFTWPPHIMVHCPRGAIHFSVILHTLDNVTVRIDREQDQCDVTGPDIKALLLLRVAAVEQHVMCTGEFLALPSLNRVQRGMFASQRDAAPASDQDPLTTSHSTGNHPSSEHSGSSSMKTTEILALVGPVGELGVCQLPIPSVGPVTNLRGYLIGSHATGGRPIEEVLDTFPDEIWAEWKSARAFDEAGFDNIPSVIASRNPLRQDGSSVDRLAPTSPAVPRQIEDPSSSSERFGPAAGDSSKTSRMAIPSRQAVTSAHLNNENADSFLGGSAADLVDVRRLVLALLPVMNRSADGGSFAGSRNNTVPTVMTSHSQALLEERHRPLLAALSVSTYFLTAYRIVFAPLEPEVRQAVVTRICAAVGVAAEDYSLTLAVRCTRLSMRYIDRWSVAATSAATAPNAAAGQSMSSSSVRPSGEQNAPMRSVIM